MTALTISTTTTNTRDGFLRFALRLDAVLSGLVGLVGLSIAPRLAELCGTTSAIEYAFSAYLVAYGLAVVGLSMLPSVRVAGLVVAIGNLAYAVAAVAVVVAGVWPLSTLGVVLTLGSGVFTLAMADLQYVGLRRLRA